MYWGWSFVNFEKRTFHVKVSFFGGHDEKPERHSICTEIAQAANDLSHSIMDLKNMET